MRSVLQCVHVMHSNGFVHRDLKLENILLSTRDTFVPIPQRIRLADFGFICRTDGGLLTLQCGSWGCARVQFLTTLRMILCSF